MPATTIARTRSISESRTSEARVATGTSGERLRGAPIKWLMNQHFGQGNRDMKLGGRGVVRDICFSFSALSF